MPFVVKIVSPVDFTDSHREHEKAVLHKELMGLMIKTIIGYYRLHHMTAKPYKRKWLIVSQRVQPH